jgi:hypothetical protein
MIRSIENKTPSGYNWVLLTSYMYDVNTELGILKTALSNEGIKFVVQNEFVSTIDPLLGAAGGGVNVMVTSDDAEEALKILTDVRAQMKEISVRYPTKTLTWEHWLVLAMTLALLIIIGLLP